MFRILILILILGAGYLVYDTYGYRYFIPNIVKDADERMSIGPADADITIVVYIDYDSHTSKRLYPKLLNLIYSDPNVRLLVRPIETDARYSKLMTRVALAAKSQDQFMNVNNIFLTSTNNVDEKYIEGVIRSSGLNYNRMKFDATSPEIENEVQNLQAEIMLLNIQTLPIMFINHVKMPGVSYQVAEIKNIINDLRTERR